jgi:hypothetical protein
MAVTRSKNLDLRNSSPEVSEDHGGLLTDFFALEPFGLKGESKPFLGNP